METTYNTVRFEIRVRNPRHFCRVERAIRQVVRSFEAELPIRWSAITRQPKWFSDRNSCIIAVFEAANGSEDLGEIKTRVWNKVRYVPGVRDVFVRYGTAKH